MRDFTYSEARQNLASLLEIDQPDGAVRIRRRDGQPFVLQPEPRNGTPLLMSNPSKSMSTPMRLRVSSENIESGMVDISPKAAANPYRHSTR